MVLVVFLGPHLIQNSVSFHLIRWILHFISLFFICGVLKVFRRSVAKGKAVLP